MTLTNILGGSSQTVAFTLCLMAGLPAVAASDYAAETLTGDWGGARSRWGQQGFNVNITEKLDWMRVTSGGLKSGGEPISNFQVQAAFDLEKLLGWKGSSALLDYIFDSGGKTNTDRLGSLLGTSSIEVPLSTGRFFQAWIERSFDEGRWSVRAGLYPVDTEFAVMDAAAVFLQPAYGAPPDLGSTKGPSIFNHSSPGVRVRWEAGNGFYTMGALLAGMADPHYEKGTQFHLRGAGAFQMGEVGWQAGSGVCGKLAAGAWRYTRKEDDLTEVDPLGNPAKSRSTGWYALGERTLARWKEGDLAGFLRVGGSDGDTTAIARWLNAGIRARGIVPGRPGDVLGVGWTRADTSSKYLVQQAAAGTPATGFESTWDLTYRLQATPWLAVQPTLQYFRNPGASTTVREATVAGVRFEVAI